MFGKKKRDEDKGLPDLPPLPASAGLRSQLDRVGEHTSDDFEKGGPLPRFPDTPRHNNFSQAAIKSAVGGRPDEMEEEMPGLPGDDRERSRVVEMEEWNPDQELDDVNHMRRPPVSMPEPEEEVPEVIRNMPAVRPVQDISSHTPEVFVKIDKFRSARKSLTEIKSKLNDADELLRRIRETKMREEQELDAWEKDMEKIKSRVADVTSNIFEKVK